MTSPRSASSAFALAIAVVHAGRSPCVSSNQDGRTVSHPLSHHLPFAPFVTPSTVCLTESPLASAARHLAFAVTVFRSRFAAPITPASPAMPAV
ncbi:hypothetical protein DFH09DRAFT_1319185 [Mycena vulgaris]|nr:hypothetical protein DFH09DRAFT_1319185 [Mycena vulgaris]